VIVTVRAASGLSSMVRGIAIELKRKKGGKVRKSQKKWLDTLDVLGWLTKVAHGADEAIDWLEEIFEGDDID